MNRPLTPPAYLLPLLDLFSAHRERAYPVGGCVRDTLLGVEPSDWDVAVTTAPETTRRLCEAAGYRVVPTGLKHGTVTVLVPHSGDPADRTGDYSPVECTACRTEGIYTDGRHPDAVAFTGRIADDLARRDFTVNAMALDRDGQGNFAVLDMFGGRDDLVAGVIRCVGDPDTRFAEDGLRLLRAVRFAVKLGFAIEPNTYAAVGRRADGLGRISRERVAEEWGKILQSPDPERGIGLLADTGLLAHVLPAGLSTEGMALVGTGRLTALPSEFSLRMAALLWGSSPAEIAENLASLRLSNAVRGEIEAILHGCQFPPEMPATPVGIRQWRHLSGAMAVPALLVLLAHICPDTEADDYRETVEAIRLTRRSEELREPVRLSELAIDGHDLIALGFRPGRPLQDVFCELLEVVWRDPAQNTRETLLREAEHLRD